MGMRSMKRQMARHMMELAGVRRINEKKSSLDMETGKVVKASYFAKHWKAYMDPESDERKALASILKARHARDQRRANAARKPGQRYVWLPPPWPLTRAEMGRK